MRLVAILPSFINSLHQFVDVPVETGYDTNEMRDSAVGRPEHYETARKFARAS